MVVTLATTIHETLATDCTVWKLNVCFVEQIPAALLRVSNLNPMQVLLLSDGGSGKLTVEG